MSESATRAQFSSSFHPPFPVPPPPLPRRPLAGHSLGAAISGLAAVELASVYGRASIPLNVSLINFGMPRIGNEPFADWFAETLQGVSWRVVHNEDIVPQVSRQIHPLSVHRRPVS